MNPSDEQRDAILIDRLVDGELSVPERRDLLASLDSQPNGWRRCALAFVEAQTWREELRGLRAQTPAKTADAVVVEPSATTSEARPSSRSQLATWLAVAASVVVAFGLGRQSGMMRSGGHATNQIASSPQEKSDAARLDKGGARGDTVTLVVNDRHGAPQRIEVPLVEGRQLGASFGDVPHWSVSPELMRKLDEQGLDLEARRRYAPIYFEQQNKVVPMVVPVDDAQVVPANRPVY